MPDKDKQAQKAEKVAVLRAEFHRVSSLHDQMKADLENLSATAQRNESWLRRCIPILVRDDSPDARALVTEIRNGGVA